jgi:hypothetical protein
VQRIYLDQNKWIDLAAAEKGQPKGKPFADVLVVLQAGVGMGEMSVPLSSAHYMETHTRRHWESRFALATTMLKLSRRHTVAPTAGVIPPEIDHALQKRYGRPATLRPLQPFGVGVAHALGREVRPYRIPDDLAPLVENRWGFERQANELQEAMLLTGLPPGMEAQLPDFDPLGHLKFGEQYAREKEALRRLQKEHKWHKGERAKRVARAQVLTDHLEPIEEACGRAGIDSGVLIGEGREGMTDFLNAVPTMLATSELERLRHSASQKPWERQDLHDINALAVASVYCDIVVTERFWVDVARRAQLGERFGTSFLSSLSELPALVV